jgi:hypothetical protein
MSAAAQDNKALHKAIATLRGQLAAHRVSRLRMTVDLGIAQHVYEFRLVKIQAKFSIEASDPGGKAAAPDGRKRKKGNKQ